MLIHSIKLTNFLSFSKSSSAIPLQKLNVIIGANGSGKSNLLEAIEMLSKAPSGDFPRYMEEGGGVREFFWKGDVGNTCATIEVVLDKDKFKNNLRYNLTFTETRAGRFEVYDEKITTENAQNNNTTPYIFYDYKQGRPIININESGDLNKVSKVLRPDDIDPTKSIIAQRKDPLQYPEITYLNNQFEKIAMYRDWLFGRSYSRSGERHPIRDSQSSSSYTSAVEANGSNLAVVLNRLSFIAEHKNKVVEELKNLYDGISDYHIAVDGGGRLMIYLREAAFKDPIPASRLSDGTLRYLFLLAILCDPTPPPLICIEEPELGLHPDALPIIARLLNEAATRTQIIITTHSDVLVDAMTDTPEAILVAEKSEGCSSLTRLNKNDLAHWLEKYRLGQLWTQGHIGGNRW